VDCIYSAGNRVDLQQLDFFRSGANHVRGYHLFGKKRRSRIVAMLRKSLS
jgi:hypothetical protein